MRKLLARGILLVLVVGVVAGAGLFASHRPVDVELELDFGSAAPKEVTLVFSRERVERELRLSYPDGAPSRNRRPLRLPKGDYTVGARLAPPERTLSRPLHVEEAGRYTLELR